MTLNEIDTLLKAFAKLGTSKVRLTGGEPTLRRDFLDILQLTSNTPGIERIIDNTPSANESLRIMERSRVTPSKCKY